MPLQCWATICDAGLTLPQHLVIVLCVDGLAQILGVQCRAAVEIPINNPGRAQ